MALNTPASGPDELHAVTIGILTYKRPWSVRKTLDSLRQARVVGPSAIPADTRHAITEVVVIDNDPEASATEVVLAWADEHGLGDVVRHVHEPEPGLAAARNRALDEATGVVLVFIDDDETAEEGWPHGQLEVLQTTGAALVGAPVLTAFEEKPPAWVTTGGFFDRDDPPHGNAVPWLRSGNLAIDLTRTRDAGVRFDPAFAFTGGEDVAFSRAAVAAGLDLRWSARGAVTELVGPDRTTARWLANRARRATASYVRANLAQEDGFRPRGSFAARGVIRLVQGVATVLVGAVTLNYARVVRGVTLLHRGFGFLEGLLGRRSRSYGAGTGPGTGDEPGRTAMEAHGE
ncbi:MAG: glycosyltransferase family A protein [Actinomycetota bacterium]